MKHRIVVTLIIEVNSQAFFQRNKDQYSSEAITDILNEVFDGGTDKPWCIVPGEDTVWIEDIKDFVGTNWKWKPAKEKI